MDRRYLNHRIIYGDAWASHPDVSSITGRPSSAHFPPVGYATPGVEARGRMSLVPFAGNADATPSVYVNEPWSCKVRKQDGKLYWTNFAGDSICRANLDGTSVEKIVGGMPQDRRATGILSRLVSEQLPAGDGAQYASGRWTGLVGRHYSPAGL